MTKSKNFKEHDFFLELIDFNLRIFQIPVEEVEDSLVYFAKDEGLISKGHFDEYLIATYIANIQDLLIKLTVLEETTKVDYPALKNQILSFIFELNPWLSYDNLVINKNNLIKLKDRVKDLEDTKALVSNDFWEYVPKEEPLEETQDIPDNKAIDIKDNKDSVPKKEKWWKLIGRYIVVRVYKEEDLSTLLKDRYFHSSVSFNTFVVTLCVENFEGLFQLLEDMGIPARVTPPLLMKELYDLCLECNPFLTYEKAQELANKNNPPAESCTSCGPNKKSAVNNSTLEQYVNKVEKKKKVFSDVPSEDLLNLATNMKVSLIGQDKVINSITEAIQRASVGLKDPVKPIGSFLFAGSTGCGKSLTGKILANELIKDRDNLITIDCSEYSADHEYSKLIGAPVGYQGYENGGILTNAILENPFSVVVFDEIEKASSKIYQLLLQVLDEGRLTDNKGNKVSFKDTVIILTSNVGVENINSISKTIGFGDVATVTADKKEKAIEKALNQRFKPEFLNRLDEIIYFNDLSKEDYYRIIDIELYKLNSNLQINNTKYKDVEIVFDKKVRQFIYEKGITKKYGARPLKRAIEKYISTPLAVKLLQGTVDSDTKVIVSNSKDKASFSFVKKAKELPKFLDAGVKE